MLIDKAATRDQGLVVRRYVFKFGQGEDDYFAFTDEPSDVSEPTPGRRRIFFSLDRGYHMQFRNRFNLGRDAILTAIDVIRSRLIAYPTQGYDLGVGEFADGAATQVVMNNATVAWIDGTLIPWLNALTVSSGQSSYNQAVGFPRTWFQAAGPGAAMRSWLFVTAGRPDKSSNSYWQAQANVAALVNFMGAVDVGYVPTDIYPVLVAAQDFRDVRFLQNTPSFPIESIDAMGSTMLAKRMHSRARSGITYQSLPVQMDPAKVNGSPADKAERKITVAKDNPLALYYRDQLVQKPMYVWVYAGQADDPDQQFVLEWSGKVLTARRLVAQNKVELRCVPMTGAFKRTGLGRNYQYGCPHALYGPLCKASLAAATVSFAPVLGAWSPTSRVLDVPAGVFAVSDARYRGGMAWWDEGGVTVRRNIIGTTGGGAPTAILDGPISQAHAASRIYLAYGCPHTKAACGSWHVDSALGGSNVVNYGGQDLIPLENPFRFVSNYY